MQVEMLDTVATVHGSYKIGMTYDLAPKRATKLIERGLAKAVVADKRTPVKRRTTSLKHGEKG